MPLEDYFSGSFSWGTDPSGPTIPDEFGSYEDWLSSGGATSDSSSFQDQLDALIGAGTQTGSTDWDAGWSWQDNVVNDPNEFAEMTGTQLAEWFARLGLQDGAPDEVFDAWVEQFEPYFNIQTFDPNEFDILTEGYAGDESRAYEGYNTWLTGQSTILSERLVGLEEDYLDAVEGLDIQHTGAIRSIRKGRDQSLRAAVQGSQTAIGAAGRSGLAGGSSYDIYQQGLDNATLGMRQARLQERGLNRTYQSNLSQSLDAYNYQSFGLLEGLSGEIGTNLENIGADLDSWAWQFQTDVMGSYDDWYAGIQDLLTSSVDWEYDMTNEEGETTTYDWSLDGGSSVLEEEVDCPSAQYDANGNCLDDDDTVIDTDIVDEDIYDPDGPGFCAEGETYNEVTGLCEGPSTSCPEGYLQDAQGGCYDPTVCGDGLVYYEGAGCIPQSMTEDVDVSVEGQDDTSTAEGGCGPNEVWFEGVGCVPQSMMDGVISDEYEGTGGIHYSSGTSMAGFGTGQEGSEYGDTLNPETTAVTNEEGDTYVPECPAGTTQWGVYCVPDAIIEGVDLGNDPGTGEIGEGPGTGLAVGGSWGEWFDWNAKAPGTQNPYWGN